jgi:anthranilate synthase component 1
MISQTKTVLADVQTPVSIYLKVRDVFPESALLESSDFHGNENSVSMIGINPMARFEVDDGQIRMIYPDGHTEEKIVDADISVPQLLDQFTQLFKANDNPIAFNGFFFFSAYDAVKYFENINPYRQSSSEVKQIKIPDIIYIFYRYVLVINHFKNEMTIIENRLENEESRIDEILSLLNNRNYASYNFTVCGEEISMISDDDFFSMVKQGIDHCKRGDVSQIVLSRRFYQSFAGDDFKVYRALRSINPSPYLFYFDFGSFRIFGSSPETHCGISKGQAYIDPIAGTFPRTGDDEKDEKLAQELLRDPKENSEHVMLVDLARNDLSKNVINIRLGFYKEVKFYSHVIHLVSRVIGDVPQGSNPIKIFADTFPA